jgi:hypothetical protein
MFTIKFPTTFTFFSFYLSTLPIKAWELKKLFSDESIVGPSQLTKKITKNLGNIWLEKEIDLKIIDKNILSPRISERTGRSLYNKLEN